MQVGERHPAPGGRSVGQRLKEACLKDSVVGTAQSASVYGSNADISAATASNGSAAATVTGRSCRQALSSGEPTPRSPGLILSEGQRNTVRIIGQYLRELGMNDTVDSLVEESGCRIENNLAHRLRECVSAGAWMKGIDVVEKLRPVVTERQYLVLRVLLLEERFKELLQQNETLAALRLLQEDYPKNKVLTSRYEYLATLLMKTNHPDDRLFETSKENSVLNLLHKILPPNIMLPPSRLEELLRQSWSYQLDRCDLHLQHQDGYMEDSALVRDHKCLNSEFPSVNTQVLHDHCSEVWCLEFSPCGKFLATGAKSDVVIIYQVDSPKRVSIFRKLYIPQTGLNNANDITGVSSLSWSHDSKFIAVSSSEDNLTGVFVFDVASGMFIRECRTYPQETYSVACFFKGINHRIVCGDQRGHFSCYNVLSNEEHPKQFEGFRIRCLYSMRDGRTVLAADTHNRIRRYDFESLTESTIICENSQIMYFTVDREEKYCLITTKHEGIRMWCLQTRTLIRSFIGSVHSEFVISSSFGGTYDNFIVSGSEDNNILIWNKNKSDPIRQLKGHTSTVNAVGWNPTQPTMLASASDDGTVRIWSSTAD